MAGSLLDIYGNYDQALNKYQGLANKYNAALDEYLGRVDEYNNLANIYNEDLAVQQAAYQAQIDAYNASVNADPNAYNQYGDFILPWQGNQVPYTEYGGKTIGRYNPIETYAAQPVEYGSTDEWGNPVSNTGYFDPRTGLGYNEGNFDYASENAYLDPKTGLVSIFASRPGDFNPSAFTGVNPGEFTMEMPTAPNAPPPQAESTSTGDIPQEQLYTKTFGRPTADVLSSEAWGLANIGTPFLSSEPTTAYETGGVAAINNPLSYVGPDSLTTGQSGVDQNSLIAGQNPYYMT